jgi:hypothetical protein
MGNPWITRPLPAPTRQTRTHARRCGCRWVWVWVLVGHVGTETHLGWHGGFASMCPLTVIVAPRFHPVSSCSRQWLGVLLWWWSLLVGGRGGVWLLAPSPPCEQVLAVVGGWVLSCLLPHTIAVDTHDPPYEQVLVGMGWVSLSSSSSSGPGPGARRCQFLAPMVHPTSRCLQAWGRCWLLPHLTGFRGGGGGISVTWWVYKVGTYIPGRYLPSLSSVGAVIPFPYPISFVIWHPRSSCRS